MTTATTPENLRLKEAAKYLGISRVTLYRVGLTDKTFPQMIRITPRCCVYKKADLDAYLTAKKEV